jgi:hypothetical protein
VAAAASDWVDLLPAPTKVVDLPNLRMMGATVVASDWVNPSPMPAGADSRSPTGDGRSTDSGKEQPRRQRLR